MINPITNLEKLLSGDESVKPVTRIEQIVKGLDVKPLTHFEQIVCGYDLKPMNRLEQIIKGLDVGGYRSREEYFWGEWASGHGEIEYVGSVPFSVIAKGGNASEWSLYGAGPYQEWTPSPEKERTANLFDKYGQVETSSSATSWVYNFKLKADTTYTISTNIPRAADRADVYFNGTSSDSNGVWNGRNITLNITKENVYVMVRKTAYDSLLSGEYWIMLNEGSTALPYEPYGYREKTGPCEVKGCVGEKTMNLFNPNLRKNDPYSKDSVLYNCDLVIGKKYTITNNSDINIGVKISPYQSGYNSVWITLSAHSSKTFTMAIDSHYATNTQQYFIFAVNSIYGVDVDEYNISIMLNEGDVALPYEPCGYKTTIIDSGKNLFDNTKILQATGWEYKNGYYSGELSRLQAVFSYANQSMLKPNDNKRYTISTKTRYINDGRNGIMIIGIRYKDGTTMVRYCSRTSEFAEYQITTSGQTVEAIYITYSDNAAVEIEYIQIEVSTTATPYVPYREPLKAVIYHDEPYFTNDYVRKDKDGGAEHTEWAKKVFDGSENWDTWTGYGATNCYILYITIYAPNNQKTKSTHFVESGVSNVITTDGFMTHSTGTNAYIIIHCNIAENLSGLKAWLKSEYDKGTPVTIYYPLSTPTDKEKDLPEILLVNGYNGIDTDTEIKPEKMSITYKATKERAEYDLQLTSDLLNVMKGM